MLRLNQELRYPETGERHWFCNVHFHSRNLRKKRKATYGAERFEDGTSQMNKSNMFFGNDGVLFETELEEMDRGNKEYLIYI